jgi:cysteine synthase A
MGIALAMAAAVKGYKFVCFMPETATEERSRIMKFLGAEVRLTPPLGPGEPVVHRKAAQEMENRDPKVWWARQFSNVANVLAHKETTGYEIVTQAGGKIDAFVASVGSGGTLMGVAMALKEKLPDRKVKIVSVEPESSPLLSKGKSGYHSIPGISDGFIPELLDTGIFDEIVLVSDKEAMDMTHRLRKEEGLFCGISSGANVVAAIKLAKEMPKGSTIVTVLPDNADRYFSMETYEV